MIEKFIQSLKQSPSPQSMFNPWYDRDAENEESAQGAKIRRQQLQLYLEQRSESARYLFIGEAVGYQGAHFSGIAMTSERILLGHQRHKNIHPSDVFQNHVPQQTSQRAKWPKGLTEPTATIVWSSLLDFGLDPYAFVLWNAVPWHPYNPKHPQGLLSNRTPSAAEMEYSQPFLQAFLQLFPNCTVLAIGQKGATMLEAMHVQGPVVRHPANGGATQFRTQTKAFLQQHSSSLFI